MFSITRSPDKSITRWWGVRRWGWVLILLGALLAHCAAPFFDAEADQLTADSQAKGESDGPPLPDRIAQVQRFGCALEGGTVVLGKVGWTVYVWADYVERPRPVPVGERDWHRWLSFREDDERAHKDCREWRREFRKAYKEATEKQGE